VAEDQRATDAICAYLQADVAARASGFDPFLDALTSLAEDDEDEARSWGRRAVSPLLDYSSLLELRRFVLPAKAARGSTKALRLAILGGPTTNQLRRLIELFLAGEGIEVEIHEADYGLFRQEILTPGSGLDAFRPEIVFLATSARDVGRVPLIDMDEEAVCRMAAAEVADWVRLWETVHGKWNAAVLQNNFEIMPGGALGHYALRHAAARQNYLERLNRLLVQSAPSYVVFHDLRGLAAEAGARAWFDPRFYLEFKMPCGSECLATYGHSVACLVRAIVGRSKKVVVLDLDNTLWGGEVGDLGPGGIRLGQGSGEGEAFLDFQRYLKELRDRGVLLAVCSKNDEDKAREPFEQRADMILKLSDISCFVANWENKADNLRSIARRLDLKLDSFVFVDDRPAERAVVRRLLPEVAVPDLPADPSGYIQALAMHRYTETVAFTREDLSRAQYYAENARREELASRFSDIRSFLASLGMRMKVEPVNALNIERATQLINKSNQFNLTTRRYTLAQMHEMAAAGDWRTLTFSLRDNLGDNGLIGVVLLRKAEKSLIVDTWVMSCRVLQRGVEQFARNELVELARKEGCDRIVGTYIPTAKNALVKDHFASLGFEPLGAEGEQTSWSLSIHDLVEPLAHYIERDAAHG
jgi:FkbH-like protein